MNSFLRCGYVHPTQEPTNNHIPVVLDQFFCPPTGHYEPHCSRRSLLMNLQDVDSRLRV